MLFCNLAAVMIYSWGIVKSEAFNGLHVISFSGEGNGYDA